MQVVSQFLMIIDGYPWLVHHRHKVLIHLTIDVQCTCILKLIWYWVVCLFAFLCYIYVLNRFLLSPHNRVDEYHPSRPLSLTLTFKISGFKVTCKFAFRSIVSALLMSDNSFKVHMHRCLDEHSCTIHWDLCLWPWPSIFSVLRSQANLCLLLQLVLCSFQ